MKGPASTFLINCSKSSGFEISPENQNSILSVSLLTPDLYFCDPVSIQQCMFMSVKRTIPFITLVVCEYFVDVFLRPCLYREQRHSGNRGKRMCWGSACFQHGSAHLTLVSSWTFHTWSNNTQGQTLPSEWIGRNLLKKWFGNLKQTHILI